MVEALTIGGNAPPFLIKARVCERMGWTFTAYDAQPANEIAALLELWNLEADLRQRAADSRR